MRNRTKIDKPHEVIRPGDRFKIKNPSLDGLFGVIGSEYILEADEVESRGVFFYPPDVLLDKIPGTRFIVRMGNFEVVERGPRWKN